MRVELGIDLLGAAPASFTRGVARRRNLDLSGLFDGNRYARTDAEARKAAAILTTPEDFAALTAIVMEGRDFAELHLAPVADIPAFADRITALRETAAASLVAVPEGKRHAIAAVESAVDGVLLDPALPDYAWCRDCVAEAGLPVILTARDFPAAPRLHDAGGLTYDPALMERLAEEGTILHLSPATDGIANWRDHPAGVLFDRGVRITVGNAAPAWHPADTLGRLADAFGWDDGVFAALERNAIDAALCDDTTRDRLKEMRNA